MDDLDRKVAEAKGWTTRDTKRLYYYEPAILIQDYRPKTNIAQAMELLEEFEEWEIQKDGLYYVVIDAIKNGDYSCNGGWQPTLNKAICVAYLKAKGKEAKDVETDI